MSKTIFSGWFGSQWFARGWFNGNWFVFETRQDAGGGSSTGHGHGAKKKREKKRRVFILPDDTVIEATEQEVQEILDLFIAPQPEKKRPKKVVTLKDVKIEGQPAQKIVLSKSVQWTPVLDNVFSLDMFKAAQARLLEILAQRTRQQEEELLLMSAFPFSISMIAELRNPLTDEELLLLAA
jgi:hypothetical protein